MSERTNIEWADSTWSPWRGCRKVSAGCQNCYIVNTVPFRRTGQKHGAERVRASQAILGAPLRWNNRPRICDLCGHPNREAEWKGSDGDACEKCLRRSTFHRRRVFSLSLGDWLDDEVPIEWLADMLDVIRRCPNLDFLLLTKRPENWLPRIQSARINRYSTDGLFQTVDSLLCRWLEDWQEGTPPQNVWMGVSVEDQKSADERIPILLSIPAHVIFLSVEPMLERIYFPRLSVIHWAIFGGESHQIQSKARICDVEWIIDGIEQCRSAGVTPFVKQLGSNAIDTLVYPGSKRRLGFKDKKGGDWSEWSKDLRVREFPNGKKKLALNPEPS